MENIVVLTGAGISAESGLSTFRDSGGLWEQYNVYEVATPEAWDKDQKLVLDFYNQRRKQVLEAEPNAAHYALASLEEKYNVTIITQNVDNLHERAGSTNIIHLHGEITKSQSSVDPSLVYDIEDWELNSGNTCEKGSQLRPHIVWFGEAVPKMTDATLITENANKLIIIGTSLNVYPAAGLIDVAKKEVDKYLVDPGEMSVAGVDNLTFIKEKASIGVPKLAQDLLATA
ncbi:MAG: NAD-dependent protein deacylase [Bacteroidetes bacterium]|nr:MAG: NAD-dependent protein deacylase [Bacteroidota bacterium]